MTTTHLAHPIDLAVGISYGAGLAQVAHVLEAQRVGGEHCLPLVACGTLLAGVLACLVLDTQKGECNPKTMGNITTTDLVAKVSCASLALLLAIVVLKPEPTMQMKTSAPRASVRNEVYLPFPHSVHACKALLSVEAHTENFPLSQALHSVLPVLVPALATLPSLHTLGSFILCKS
jgi:hypothetical protein